MKIATCFLVVVVLLSGSAATYAQFPAPTVDQIFPLGGQAGAEIDLELLGTHLEGADRLFADHPGITGAPVEGKPNLWRLKIAADVPRAVYDLRVISRWGVSGPKSFQVDAGIQEVVKTEPNDSIAQAQSVSVDTAINGRSDGANFDFYKLSLAAGQRICVDVDCQRLEVQLDSNVAILDASGRSLAANGDYHGRDSFLDFTAPAAGDYFLTFNDLSYRGGPPYRLIVTSRPRVETISPRAVQRGQTVSLAVLGQNLGGAIRADRTASGAPLEEIAYGFTAPGAEFEGYRYFDAPLDHSPLPTTSTARIDGLQIRPTTPRGETYNAATVLIVDEPVVEEREGNDQADAAESLAIPVCVSGRFDAPRDADWYEFEIPESADYAFDVFAEAFGSPSDPYLAIVDDKGNRLVEHDDYGHRMNSFDAHTRDPVGGLSLEKGRKYRVLVQDRYRRGGLRHQYVLRIRKRAPDTFVAVVQTHNNRPTATLFRKGGATYLDVVLNHRDGAGTPVTLFAEGLPPWMHMAPTTIPNDIRGAVVLWCDENAPDWQGDVRIVAEFLREGQPIRRTARHINRVWDNAGNRPTRTIAASVRDTAPFLLKPKLDRVEVVAGEKIDVPFELTRMWPEFVGEMKLLPLQFTGPIQMPETTISAGAGEGIATISTQTGMFPGEYTLAVLGQAQIPFHKDPDEKNRPNTLVSMPSLPLQLIVKKKE